MSRSHVAISLKALMKGVATDENFDEDELEEIVRPVNL